MLSIGTEESLSTFFVDSFVPVLVGLLNHETNPDIMLLAARAITHLVDVLPSSCAVVVHYGAVSCFFARLLTIEYMDLAEQSLQALKKISQKHPTACLRAGALMAVLSYLDFFSTGVQRVALATAANMCKKLPSDAADFVMEVVPHLTYLLQYHDAKVLEHALVCLTRIVEAFSSSLEKLDELCNHGLVTQATSLISTNSAGGGQASLTTSTYTGLIRLLSTWASGSTAGAKTLLLLGVTDEFSPGYYGICTADRMLSAATTHLAITPLDILKVNMQVDPVKYNSMTSGLSPRVSGNCLQAVLILHMMLFQVKQKENASDCDLNSSNFPAETMLNIGQNGACSMKFNLFIYLLASHPQYTSITNSCQKGLSWKLKQDKNLQVKNFKSRIRLFLLCPSQSASNYLSPQMKGTGDFSREKPKFSDQCTAFVSNLNFDTNNDNLGNFFSDVGGVVGIRILKDRFTGKSRVNYVANRVGVGIHFNPFVSWNDRVYYIHFIETLSPLKGCRN